MQRDAARCSAKQCRTVHNRTKGNKTLQNDTSAGLEMREMKPRASTTTPFAGVQRMHETQQQWE